MCFGFSLDASALYILFYIKLPEYQCSCLWSAMTTVYLKNPCSVDNLSPTNHYIKNKKTKNKKTMLSFRLCLRYEY